MTLPPSQDHEGEGRAATSLLDTPPDHPQGQWHVCAAAPPLTADLGRCAGRCGCQRSGVDVCERARRWVIGGRSPRIPCEAALLRSRIPTTVLSSVRSGETVNRSLSVGLVE